MTSFDQFYDTFLQNSLRGRTFLITLDDGTELEGVPTAGSIANPADPNAAFAFHDAAGGVQHLPFRKLHGARPK